MIAKPISRLVQELEAVSFTVIGSPCSAGLGGETLQLFAEGLIGARGDFIVIPGGVSPLGRRSFYNTIAGFIERTSVKPVHVLRGDADGSEFGEYFGVVNRAVIAEDFALVMLDNPEGHFSDITLSFLRDTLAISEDRAIIVCFHMPPPNRLCGDSMTAAEWERFEEAVGVWRKRISLLVCGHAPSHFEDEVDGIRLIVSGAGSRVRERERIQTPPPHALEFAVDSSGDIQVRRRPLLAGPPVSREPEVKASLEQAFADECRAQVCLHLEAEEAARGGLGNLARIYRAAAESSLHHARILRRILMGSVDPRLGLAGCPGPARPGWNDAAGDRVAAADMAQDILAAEALGAVMRADRAFFSLFEKALHAGDSEGDGEASAYYVCQSCGFIHGGPEAPAHCEECGAPAERIHEVP